MEIDLRFLRQLVLMAIMAAPAAGQSVVTSAVSGVVRDTSGRALVGVHVILNDRVTGFVRDTETRSDGGFGFRFLPPGVYDVTLEALGYRPVRIERVRVAAGAEIDLEGRLTATPPPVDSIEVMEGGVLVTGGSNGFGYGFSDFELRRLPDRQREVAGLTSLSTIGGDAFEGEGLPGTLSGITVDGVPFGAAQHPWIDPGPFHGAPFGLSAVSEADLIAGGLDVEWSGVAGSRLHAVTRSGSRRLEVRGFGDWYGDATAGSRFFNPKDATHSSVRGGLTVTGPIVRDTAHFALGMEFRRLQVPHASTWVGTSVDSEVSGIASDSFGVALAPFLASGISEAEVFSGFGRFDWQLTDRTRISVRGNGAKVTATDPPLGTGRIPAVGLELEGRDISTAATLTTALATWAAVEFRAGLSASRREYIAGDVPPASLIPSGPVAFGLDATQPGVFERSDIFGSAALHIESGAHRLKLGGMFRRVSIDQTFRARGAGEYVFGGVDGFAGLTGSFVQAVGGLAVARFAPVEFGGFLQDRWRVGPGAELVAGMRLAAEQLPQDRFVPNADWFLATRVGSDTLDLAGLKVSPRVGLVWDVGNQHRWVIRAESAVQQGLTDPGVFGELLAESGSARIRRGTGPLGSWPTAPDSGLVPPSGRLLTLLGPRFQSPRTSRAAFGISGALGGGTVLQLSALYRHTEFLPRRHDLNRLQASAGTDQHGRRLYGTLEQYGPVLVAEPGSNRRIPEFDVVTSFDPDGYSDYWGFTVQVERRLGRTVRFVASYTRSGTKDNWLSGRNGGFDGQLTPFPDSLLGNDWADGTSDFDIPNRLLTALEVSVGIVRVAGVYRYRTGYPFTPGYRDGVDANGDGSGRNDPAFVDESIAGVNELFPAWDCLRAQVGRFAERNSCRGPGVSSLDVRVAIGPLNFGYPFEIIVDVLNLIENELVDRDRALYVIDEGGALSLDPATGQVTVPLLVNPNFGNPIVHRTSGRSIRLGLRVNYE